MATNCIYAEAPQISRFGLGRAREYGVVKGEGLTLNPINSNVNLAWSAQLPTANSTAIHATISLNHVKSLGYIFQ
jgi:hypothetical protein